ncbi:MAG: NTP transferase domain-containing protein [Candidatus Bathyarchaeota archaeon]|uniref:NTP transferase domain-containing protein n=1 Tax=Candidatus Bathycorpusculum sp. TaxID=2994959 RepID=UPI0028348258|nr:NTP transferase domain-containing protein [Candidatus Termiticorpusculum sp.]MCL2256595.1 NTP transferase domain-containing protein [Candidatus Termiticorpusculum sp.]MCL2293217.1 NTP transferase domain-containing protein [Candidatus Termiticorpusculum sp.]
MGITALVMAGGKGSRMGLSTEKPMIPFKGKHLIDYIIAAINQSKQVTAFYIVTSSNTPNTEQHCKNMGWNILHTDAKGYHDDLRQAAHKANLTGPILTMPSDVPAITGKFLDKVVCEFEQCNKDFLAVFVPIQKRLDLGLSISSTDEYKGVWYAVSGINIINGKKIHEKGKIETSAIITEEIEVLLNINTQKDIEIAKKLLDTTTT